MMPNCLMLPQLYLIDHQQQTKSSNNILQLYPCMQIKQLLKNFSFCKFLIGLITCTAVFQQISKFPRKYWKISPISVLVSTSFVSVMSPEKYIQKYISATHPYFLVLKFFNKQKNKYYLFTICIQTIYIVFMWFVNYLQKLYIKLIIKQLFKDQYKLVITMSPNQLNIFPNFLQNFSKLIFLDYFSKQIQCTQQYCYSSENFVQIIQLLHNHILCT
eukprot:TRINITY_DN12828_c0_g1_i2.p1 TRINITY_DN12828_c0_g1~~TRINITY_DN12828_c0_g1_i2.p1  ORF type:complete len:216 (-),score=-27.54 TRINITY_DN12828_c0_g1_i2:336-983(-)